MSGAWEVHVNARHLIVTLLLATVTGSLAAGAAQAEFRVDRTVPIPRLSVGAAMPPGDVAATDSAVYVGVGNVIDVLSWAGAAIGRIAGPGAEINAFAVRPDGTLFVVADRSELVKLAPSGTVVARWRILTPDSRSYLRNIALEGRNVSVLATLAGNTVIRSYGDSGEVVRETALPYPALHFAPGPSGRYFTNIAGAGIDLFGPPARVFGSIQSDPPAGSFSGDGPTDYAYEDSDRTLIVSDYGGARVSAFDAHGRVLDACPAVRSTPATAGPVGLPAALDVSPSGRIAVANQWTPGVTLLRRVARTTRPCDRGPAALLTSRLSRTVATSRPQRRSIGLLSRLSKPGVLRICVRGPRVSHCVRVTARTQQVQTNLSRLFKLSAAPRGRYTVVVRSKAAPTAKLRLRLA